MTKEELDKCYVIGDLHFCNAEIAAVRGFSNVDEMHAKIWSELNKLPDDSILLFIGDYIDNPDADMDKYSIKRFKRTIAVTGNHDDPVTLMMAGFRTVTESDAIYFNDLDVVLSHEPIRLKSGTTIRNIHGHIHTSPNKYGQEHPEYYLNLSADAINYVPMKLSDAMAKLGVDTSNVQFLQTQTIDVE